MKRYTPIPSDIQIVDLASGEPLFLGNAAGERSPWLVSFKAFVCGTLLPDPKFGKTASTVISGAGIRTALEAPGGFLVLEGDDWELLKSVLESPENRYKPEVALQLIPFFRAILDATTTDPRPTAG
jgi:hypothetical protein